MDFDGAIVWPKLKRRSFVYRIASFMNSKHKVDAAHTPSNVLPTRNWSYHYVNGPKAKKKQITKWGQVVILFLLLNCCVRLCMCTCHFVCVFVCVQEGSGKRAHTTAQHSNEKEMFTLFAEGRKPTNKKKHIQIFLSLSFPLPSSPFDRPCLSHIAFIATYLR